MIGAALPSVASLAQALIGADAPVATDPAAGLPGADFAMMMAGLGTAAPPAASDDAADAAPAHDAARGKDPRDEDDARPQDAALLAMLTQMPQAAPPDAATPKLAADVQAPATISSTARAAVATSVSVTPPAAPAAEQASDAGPAATAPKAPVGKAIAALKLKLAADPEPASADIATLAAAILEVRPAGAKTTKPSDAATSDANPVPAPPQAADTSAIAIVAQTLPADPPRPAHVTRASPDTLGAALGEQRLSLAQGSGWLDQLARDIASTAGVEGKLHFRLNPEHLGSLHVEVTRGAEGAAVRLTADTRNARDILVDAQPQLVAEARAQGVRIAGTHVDLSDGTGGGRASDHGRRQAQGFTPQVRAIGAAAAIDTTEPRGAAPERYA